MKIQTRVRGKLARKKVQTEIVETKKRQAAALVVQCAFRVSKAKQYVGPMYCLLLIAYDKESNASTQQTDRRFKGLAETAFRAAERVRCFVEMQEKQRQEEEAALKAIEARLLAEQREASARLIQAQMRGMLGRKKFNEMRKEYDAKLEAERERILLEKLKVRKSIA